MATPAETTGDACQAAVESIQTLHETIGTTAIICIAIAMIVLVFRTRK